MRFLLPSLSFILLALSVVPAGAPPWTLLDVPGAWEEAGGQQFAKYDGIAWYRCFVKVPETWKGDDLSLTLHSVDNCYQVFFNGTKIGEAGAFPPGYRNGLTDQPVSYTIPANLVQPGQANLIALRVYDHDGRGGFTGAAPMLGNESQAIALKGKWLFRTGDDPAWAKEREADLPKEANFLKVENAVDVAARLFPNKGGQHGLSPAEALKRFKVPADLQLDLVLAEPTVRQPVFVNFDERGRMWVVQYLQYPNPAGLKIMSRDKYWRNIYDKVPPPPPHHFPGKDKITIHEDTDGDGVFDKHKTFVEGLNIATAVERGRGGVWVLNPPYLLFYPDKNNDDIPDGDPEVHLQGFGMEDTHAVVNSLRWGPDGWLYATQGSTVSAKVQQPGSKAPPVHSMGQLVWRYHPETRRYEIFAEGGGNAFGVEIDSHGHTYSGHNGGNTRGFHYVQGGYYQKGFSKHGPISNPFSFGYFPPMNHPAVPRFTHTFLLYEGNNLPARYQGKLMGVAPMLNHVVTSDIFPDGSSFQTKDIEQTVATTDPWFRPVDIKLGPDGALYVADWYDSQINHFRNHEGQIDPGNGRIYRLKTKDSKLTTPGDLGKKTTAELIDLLRHDNRWVRQTVLRLLGDRKDPAAIGPLKKLIAAEKGHVALEALWACHLSGGFDESLALETLTHPNPFVRLWTVRLLGDDGRVSLKLSQRLTSLAREETNVEVRSQLACTARRLPGKDALPLVRELLQHKEDKSDIHIPLLLWWALETRAETERAAVVDLFGDSAVWDLPLVEQHILDRLMRRYAQAGTQKDLLTCARLLELAPSANHAKKLLAGFEQAYAGRSLANLPEALVQIMAKRGGGSLALRLRLGDEAAYTESLQMILNEKADGKQRQDLVRILGEIKKASSVPILLQLVSTSKDQALRQVALTSLTPFDSDTVGRKLIELHDKLPADVRGVAESVLLSRKTWTRQFLQAVDQKQVQKDLVPPALVRQMTMHTDEEIRGLVTKHWGNVQGATTEDMQKKIVSLQKALQQSTGSPYEGRKLFQATCAKCHTLFTQGGQIGPDLTAYKRDDLNIMLLHVVNPSAEIREGFENHLVTTKDGRFLTGFLIESDNKMLMLRTAEGQDVRLERGDVDDSKVLPQSLMPQGLLDAMNDQQVRDLFAYLRSTQPLNE